MRFRQVVQHALARQIRRCLLPSAFLARLPHQFGFIFLALDHIIVNVCFEQLALIGIALFGATAEVSMQEIVKLFLKQLNLARLLRDKVLEFRYAVGAFGRFFDGFSDCQTDTRIIAECASCYGENPRNTTGSTGCLLSNRLACILLIDIYAYS